MPAGTDAELARDPKMPNWSARVQAISGYMTTAEELTSLLEPPAADFFDFFDDASLGFDDAYSRHQHTSPQT